MHSQYRALMIRPLTVTDLTRPLGDVASGLVEWERGDEDEAVLATLELSAAGAHARAYTAWAWTAHDIDGTPVVLLPVHVRDVERFAPAGPVRVLVRSIAAVVACGATIDDVRAFEWNGLVGLRAPEADLSLFPLAWGESHPSAARTDCAAVPGRVVVDTGLMLRLAAPRTPADTGLGRLSRTLRTHPLRFIHVLWEQGWRLEEESYPEDVVEALRHRGFEGPPIPADDPSLAIDDDPDHLRRIARRLVRRLLHKGKIGPGHHTAFDHIAHGVPPADRAEAYRVGEALVRAGFLGEKPSVGQRHIYLRREALPDIHAFITSGETRDPDLAELWTVPFGSL